MVHMRHTFKVFFLLLALGIGGECSGGGSDDEDSDGKEQVYVAPSQPSKRPIDKKNGRRMLLRMGYNTL